MSCKSLGRISAACFVSALTVSAEPNADAKPARHVRFLAMGDSPPFRQEIRDGVRYELDPPPDSIPPRQVIPGFGKETAEALDLRLGRISALAKVPAGEATLDLRAFGQAPDAAPWVSLKTPASGDFLVFLFRNPAKPTWKDAVSLIVPDGAAGAPAGTLRIVNLFPLSIRIMWGGETVILPAGKTILRTVKPGSEIPFQILVADATGSMKRYYSSSVTQNQGERGLVTIYRADGEDPRRPLKVAMLREPVPPEPPPSSDDKKP